jgi:hypothetical protein
MIAMPSIPLPAYRKLVRASAVYDIVVTAPFATPWGFALLHDHISAMNELLGGEPLPVFGPFHVMIAGMMGTVVLIWSVLRLIEGSVRLGRFDGAGRFAFAALMAWTLAQTGAPVLWAFLIPEFAWGVAQWWPVAGQSAHRRVPLFEGCQA